MLLKPLSTAFAFCLSASVLHAQNDSSSINAGALKLSKHFTQNVTIKGEDIERFPFSSLEDAINVYFNGAYTNAENLLYVIDGNLGADINAYSAHDIESITLLQDARALVGGVHRAQQVVIVQTRTRMTGKSSLTASASTYLTKRRDQNNSSLYYQVNTTGRYSRRNFEVGASVSYLRDAVPGVRTDKTIDTDPEQLSRLSGNAWVTAILGRSVLSVRLNVSPKKFAAGELYMVYADVKADDEGKIKYLQLYPTATLSTQISKKFYNEFNAGYTRLTAKSHAERLVSDDNGNGSFSLENSYTRYREIFAREEFGFNHLFGNWQLNTSLNVYGTFRKEKFSENAFATNGTAGGIMASMSENLRKEHGLIFTPVFNITQRSIFNFQGGVQYNTTRQMWGQADKKIHPFALVAVDLLRMANRDSRVGLMLHGSYAETKSDLFYFYRPAVYVYRWANGVIEPVLISSEYATQYKLHRATAAGVTFSLAEDRLKFTYTHEQKGYSIDSYRSVPTNSGYVDVLGVAKVNLRTHRIGVQYETSAGKNFRYKTLLGVYKMQSTLTQNEPGIYVSPFISQGGYPQPGWSGGLTNEICINKFIAGVNALYYFDEHTWVSEYSNGVNPSLQKSNSIIVQHIYAGYQINRSELYLSGRNLFGDSKSLSLNGDVVYVGIGAKISLLK